MKLRSIITTTASALLPVLPASAAMVVHLTFDNTSNLGENSGTGTFGWNSSSNAIAVADGKFGGGANFNTTIPATQYWDNNFNSTGTQVSNFTMSLHFRTTSDTNWDDFASIGIGNDVFRVEQTASNSLALYNDGIAGENPPPIAASSSINDGLWHHAAIVSNGSTIELFLDGQSVGSSAFTGTGALTSFQLGSQFGNGARAHPDADLDDVAVYDEALSAHQINWLASNQATSSPVPEPGSYVMFALCNLALLLRRRR